jgi:peptidase M50B-like protein
VSIDGVTDLWDKLFGAQPDPPGLLVLITALIALAVVASRPVWRVARNAITIAHEGGHALVALLTGRKLRGIRLEFDTSGLTLSAGRPTGPGMIFTLLAGYIAPSLVGLAGAWILGGNRITLLLWLAVVLLLLMLINIRNLFGVISVVITGAIVFAVSWYASPQVQAAFAYVGVWFLLLGGVRPVGELQRLRARGRMPESDADQLGYLTHVPAFVWVMVFYLVNVAALAVGGFMLAGQWLPAFSTQ